jgi:hypothetical protein
MSTNVLTLGRALRLLDRAKNSWGSGDSFALIEEAQGLIRQAQQGMMRGNPLSLASNPPTKQFGKRVLAVEYIHKKDGLAYRHEFRKGAGLFALADGTLVIAPV